MQIQYVVKPCRLALLALFVSLFTFSLASFGQSGFPSKPVKIVVAYAPGGTTDTMARLLGQKLSEVWGKPVVVDNKPGGGGAIAAEFVARSAADGHTIFLGTIGEMAINPSLESKINYDPQRDFAPVAKLAVTPLLLVAHPNLAVKSVKELIELAKSKPDHVSFLSTGQGSSQHMSGEILKKMTGTKIVHVPYKGGAPQTAALLAGQEPQFGFVSIGNVLPYIQSGKLRAIAVSNANRYKPLPDVPTIEESNLAGFNTAPWMALFVPTNTSKEIIQTINAESIKILLQTDVKDRLTQMGFELTPSTPQELASFVQSEISKYRNVVDDLGLRNNP
jgi:tripartite-type tricarboxylate transporter receptor subunit TctC